MSLRNQMNPSHPGAVSADRIAIAPASFPAVRRVALAPIYDLTATAVWHVIQEEQRGES